MKFVKLSQYSVYGIKIICLTGNGILERSFPIQFLSRFQRLSLTFGLGGMVWRLLARVGTISPLRKLAAGPDGIYMYMYENSTR